MTRTPAAELAQAARDGLLRKLHPLESAHSARVIRNGRELWNFASNDYLGLARHPRLAEAFIDGIRRWGAGSSASRLVTGTQPPHISLEEELAAAKQSDAALVFPSGFTTALGVIPALAGKDDFIVADKLCHASLIDAARLSGATLRVFPHNDAKKAGTLLAAIRLKHASARILLVTESVFSMDGDLCPLRELCDIAETHDAHILLDEAHGFGVLGESGMGLAEQLGVQQRVTFQMGTLSKAAGLAGGYVAASREWIDLLVNRSRAFIYTTAPPPALACAAREALHIIRSDEGKQLRTALHANARILSPAVRSAIVPVVFGSNDRALAAAAKLEQHGFLVPAIRYPTVARGSARLRISVSAAHPAAAVKELTELI
ncbi:MAG: 8-amino-7-oxononanoate synthase [Verrucomicrobiota bacterium]